MSTTPAQCAANIANAQLSTGPKTEEGKAASSQNNFRHGLCGAFVVQNWENADDYVALLDGLRVQHQPANPTEALLVEQMAQHWWLSQRALRLQELSFHSEGPVCSSEKELALYMRYGVTHERAFSKALTDLNTLRAEQRKAAERMERLAIAQRAQETSLKRQALAEVRKTELHAARLESLDAKAELDRAKAAAKAGPLPNFNMSYEDRVREMMALDAPTGSRIPSRPAIEFKGRVVAKLASYRTTRSYGVLAVTYALLLPSTLVTIVIGAC